ncbi:CPBP family intramembrane metalloprotease [bacterium]|nr:CPBP family intramembrane metalloprotease [bacterium]
MNNPAPHGKPPDHGSITPMQMVLVLVLSVLAYMLVQVIFFSTAAMHVATDMVSDPGKIEQMLSSPEELETLAERVIDLVAKGVAAWPWDLKLIFMLNQAVIILPVLLFLRTTRRDILGELRIRPVPRNMLLHGALAGVGLAVVGDELTRLIDLIVPIPEEIGEALRMLMTYDSGFDFLVIFATICLIAPLVEEMLFRGFIQRWTEGRIGVTNGVMLTSALFAFVHGNKYFVIPILIMAVVIGAIAWRTESVWPSVALHGTNNLIGFVTANVWEDDPGWYSLGDHVAPWWVLGAAILVVYSVREIFRSAEASGMGGHGPGGDTGGRVDKTV